MSVISHTVVVHKAAIASREYPCHGFFVIETYRAIAQDGSVVGISPAMFNSFEGDRGYFRTEQTGSEAPESWGTPFEEFQQKYLSLSGTGYSSHEEWEQDGSPAVSPEDRHCTCGSGEFVMQCGANSQYCG
jgi:hypothetical protein